MFKDYVTDKIVILSKLGKDLELVSSSIEPNMEIFAVSWIKPDHFFDTTKDSKGKIYSTVISMKTL